MADIRSCDWCGRNYQYGKGYGRFCGEKCSEEYRAKDKPKEVVRKKEVIYKDDSRLVNEQKKANFLQAQKNQIDASYITCVACGQKTNNPLLVRKGSFFKKGLKYYVCSIGCSKEINQAFKNGSLKRTKGLRGVFSFMLFIIISFITLVIFMNIIHS